MANFVARICAIILLTLLWIFPSCAGEPPFPSELMYPNVVPPKVQFGTYGDAPGTFSEPRAGCFLGEDRLLVAEAGNHRLQLVKTDGTSLETWDASAYGPDVFVAIGSLACNEDRVVVSDIGTNRILLFSVKGELIRSFGDFGAGPGQFNEPTGLALFGDKIAVADSGNNRVQVLSLEGEPLLQIGGYGRDAGQFNHPMGVTIDARGDIYVADSWNNRVQKFSIEGLPLAAWGEWGSHAGFFATPSSISSVNDHIYVTDLTNHRIQVFDAHGHFLFQWGRHPALGHDGNGRTHYPWHLAVDRAEQRFALIEPIENRIQVFEKTRLLSAATNVNDSAWWDKATRFHYGSRTEVMANLLAVSEPDTHSVLTFDISGAQPALISRLGGRGTALGQFIEPSGMAIDPSKGEILVTDAGNLRLQTLSLVRRPPNVTGLEAVSSPLGFLTDLGRALHARTTVYENLPAPGQTNREKQEKFVSITGQRPLAYALLANEKLIYPGALKRAPDGEIYLYDQAAAKILVIRDGAVRTSFGGYGTEPGQFRSVHNMSFSRDGQKLFVVDSYNFRVQIFDRDGHFIRAFGKPGHLDDEFSHLFGIASGVDGFIYLTDEAKHCIYKYTEDGVFVARWGRWGTDPGELYKPKGIAQHASGKIYVLSFGNHRGEMYSPEGQHLGSFGLADPETPRGKDLAELLSRPAYSISAKALLNRDVTTVLNGSTATVSSPGQAIMVSGEAGYRVTVTSSTPLAASDDVKTLQVTVVNAKTGQPADVTLDFDAVMPAHGHGLMSRPQQRTTGVGSFEISNVRLSMMGIWELHFDIRNRHDVERSQLAVFVR